MSKKTYTITFGETSTCDISASDGTAKLYDGEKLISVSKSKGEKGIYKFNLSLGAK